MTLGGALSELNIMRNNPEIPVYFKPVIEKIIETIKMDAQEVRYGEWEPSDKYKGYASCSLCHDCYVEPEWVSDLKWNYCPSCGARMV